MIEQYRNDLDYYYKCLVQAKRGNCKISARHIANRVRNISPEDQALMMWPCYRCHGRGHLVCSRGGHNFECYMCSGSGEMQGLSFKDPLYLYIESLKIWKGSKWFDWLTENSGWSHSDSHGECLYEKSFEGFMVEKEPVDVVNGIIHQGSFPTPPEVP